MNTIKSLRKQVYGPLNPGDQQQGASAAVNFFVISLILVNVIAASLETVEALYVAYRPVFFSIEVFSVAVFTVEYVLRLWTEPERPGHKSRVHFVLSFDSIIDLLAITPFYIGFFFGVDLRALIAVRLLRLLKLVRYFEPLAILGTVMKAEFRAFMAAMFVLMILVFVAATGIYLFEREVQPNVFGSIPQSMWWAIVTLTTLGYGDVIPLTVAGRVFAAFITILSIGTVALPAGMLASRFSEELRKRKSTLEEQIFVLASDGSLCEKKVAQLEKSRDKLCLSEGDMNELLDRNISGDGACPLWGTAAFPSKKDIIGCRPLYAGVSGRVNFGHFPCWT